jgi:Fe-S-cluster containining protein
MDREPIPPYDIPARVIESLATGTRGAHAESRKLMFDLILGASRDEDRYFLCLHAAEILMRSEESEDSRELLMKSAQIALRRNDRRWLARSHEKLGDLSAAEEDWFGALHQYRYSLRNGGSFLERSSIERLEAKINSAQRTLHSTVLAQDATIIPLRREHASGNLAISFVHRDIFLKKYFARCLECSFCHDWCCSFGADIDIQNVEKIQQQKEEILPFVRPPVAEWFDEEFTYYEEYAGNYNTRINPHGSRCAFISKDQRGCGLHRYAISKGMDYHEIKPLVCILFPLSFGEGILSIAPELDDGSLVCSGSGDSAYRAMSHELEHYFGQDLLAELTEIEEQILSDHQVSIKRRFE